MDKIIKQLLKDSVKLRNLSVSPKYSTLQSHENSLQDTLAHKMLERYEDDRKKLNSLRLDHDPKSIIKNIRQNYKDMDAKGAINVMETLQNAFYKNKELSYINLKDSEEFVYICKLIHQNLRTLYTHDLIRVLRILLFFNVPPNSVVIQTILQLLRGLLNNLSVGQIMILYNTLNKVERLPLVASLLAALPHVFKQQAQFELNSESNNLLLALKFSSTVNDLKTKIHILNILYKNERNIKSEHIIDIFNALYTLPRLNSSFVRFLFRIKNQLRINSQSLTFNEIQRSLDYISLKVANGETQFYCNELIDSLCNAVLNHDVAFSQNITILKYLNKMRYSNTSLLDHLAAKCAQDRDILKYCSVSDVDHLIKGFIIADYKPACWETIQPMILDFVKCIDYSVYNAASVAFRLLSLDCYCPELIEKAFTLYQSEFVSKTHEKMTSNILKLYWCVKFLYPQYNGVTLDEATLDKIDTKHERDEVPCLLGSLKKALAGEKYLKTGLRTKFGEFVDYVVVVQPNGFPMDVNSYDIDVAFVEDLESLPKCDKILFFVFPETAYSFNKQNMLSTVQLPLKAIESLKGFHTIAVNPFLWKTFSEKDKILHLQQAIRSKCNISGMLRHF